MANKKKLIYPMLAGVVALATACSGGNPSTGKTAESGGDKPAEQKKEPVELVFYSQVADYDETFMDVFGNMIQKKYPHITVKHLKAGSNKVADVVATGQTIDVMFMSIGQADTLTTYDYQYDISELIKTRKFDLSKLEPSSVELQKGFANNGMYGLPVFTNTLSLFYNKNIFDKFGVEYPKDGMNWDQLKDLAKRLSRSEGGVNYNGLVMSSSANIVLNQFSAAYLDPATKKSIFTTDNFKKAFDLLTSVSKIPGNELNAQTWSLAGQQKMFFQDQSAAMLLHFVVLSLSTLKDQFNWDIATYPQLADKPGVGPQSYPTYFYVTKTGKHKEDAFDAIAYLTSEEFQNHLAKKGMLPILKDRVAGMAQFGQDVPMLKNKNVKALMPEKFAPSALTKVEIVKGQSPGHTAFFEAYQNVVLGTKDTNTALREAGEKLDQKLADLFK
ncbi:extracellular solute-binding protein [Paenibacillus hemerocallicola]|uniref:Extracellular solute-binding protein n=1 Tax=Paenibacillus hemerocallicola TaxID=1172614 RepID=A0A5C4TDQ3_9BACL|nr:extracellular solute-binding protein [Paenibacillus hemerocallicola]TNJ66637.1 extracellular solute-binding protein [Paenibacillus hemerocallicola]